MICDTFSFYLKLHESCKPSEHFLKQYRLFHQLKEYFMFDRNKVYKKRIWNNDIINYWQFSHDLVISSFNI